MADEILVDAKRAAELLGLGETTVRELTADDKIPYVQVGRRKLYRPAGLARWAEEREVYPALEEERHGEATGTGALAASRRAVAAGRPAGPRKPGAPKTPLGIRLVPG